MLFPLSSFFSFPHNNTGSLGIPARSRFSRMDVSPRAVQTRTISRRYEADARISSIGLLAPIVRRAASAMFLSVSFFLCEELLSLFRVDDRGCDGSQRDGCRFNGISVEIQDDRHIDNGNGLGAAQGQFNECPALGGSHRRKRYIHQHFIRLHDCFTHAGIKFCKGDGSFAVHG